MKRSILTLALLALYLPETVSAADPIDEEMTPLLLQVRSEDPSERTEAVEELLRIRQSVADELTAIVERVNQGDAPEGAKASALYLMGELGLLQCSEVLENEKDWVRKPDKDEWMGLNEEYRHRSVAGEVAKAAILRSGTAANVSFDATFEGVSLEQYPTLQAALSAIESPEADNRRHAENQVARWYEVVCRGTDSILQPSNVDLYPDCVKITAAYLLGEYRSLSNQMLLWNIDLLDKDNVCGDYGGALSVRMDDDRDRPCAVALRKIGTREFPSCLGRIETKPELSQETRDRIARTFLAVYGDTAREKYAAELKGWKDALADPERSGNWSDEQIQERISLLESVRPILGE